MSSPTSRPAFAVVLLCLSGLAPLWAACFYTGRINGRPTVQIAGLDSHFPRGKTVLVNAQGTDPDGDRLRYAWYVVPGACAAAPPDPATTAPDQVTDPPLMLALPQDSASSVCVWVTVTDTAGAVSLPASAALSTTNQPPTAVIDVQQPAPNAMASYDLFSVFRLAGTHSTDPDGDDIVMREWTLTADRPDTFRGGLVPCSPTPPDDQVMCLDVGALPGLYVVRLRVHDGFDWGAPVEARLQVAPDRPPCIADTEPAPEASPIVWDPADARSFTVNSVSDDGAPYPASTNGGQHTTATFAWSLRRNGGAWDALVGFEALNRVTLLGGSYDSGDVVDVKVAISDGEASHQLLPPAGCASTVTWTVEYR